MKLCLDTAGTELGQAGYVPTALAPFIIPWSKIFYYEVGSNRILIQEFIADQFSVFSWRLWIDDAIMLYPIAEQPTVALQFMLRGNITCELAGYGEKKLKEYFSELFYVPPHNNQAFFEPGEYHTFHIELSPLYLVELSGKNAAIRLLLAKMEQGSSEGGFLEPVYLHYISIHHLQELQGAVRGEGFILLHLQRHIYALLMEYLFYFQMQQEPTGIKIVAHEARIRRLKEYVLKEPNVKKQTIPELARLAGISSSALKLAFKFHTDTSLSSFVRFHALSKAHFLLTTTSLSVEDIGLEIGYSTLASFRRAFVNEFGYLPDAVRHKK